MIKFEEVNASYTLPEAIKEAQRCLRCKVPQCKNACPINNEIPEWIHELMKGNLGNAIHIIRSKSNLPAVCGRVCAHEKQCEGACILNKQGKGIKIGKLERFVADFDAVAGLTHENLPAKTRGRVAVIGSGPAGITVAGDLSRKGFNVDVFEMEAEAGGMLMFGIPQYRLPKEVVRNEVRHLEELGVTFHYNCHIGVDLTIEDIFKDGFDAIFIGIGSGKPRWLPIPVHTDGSDEVRDSKDINDVRLGTHFLRRVQLCSEGLVGEEEVTVKPGHHVFVVGCGNTAMDAARTAVRLGAEKVEIIYRRGIDRMAALKSEYDDAVSEGILFNWNSSIVDIHCDADSHMKEITIETRPAEGEEGENSYKTIKADRVIMAVGATPSTTVSRETTGIENDGRGFLFTREVPYGMTSRKGVFAGGDVANRQATVVHAMRDAKMVTEGIAQYVDAVRLMKDIEEAPHFTK